jgi:hypothetical protein
MLRDLDPTAQRYRAVVLGVDDYDDEDRAFGSEDDVRDLHYVIARLRFSDAVEFARSFRDRNSRRRDAAPLGIIYRTISRRSPAS